MTRAGEPLEVLQDRVRPVTLTDDQRLPALPALAGVLPGGGLRRGTVVALEGAGATTLLWALLTPPTAGGAWAALVGLPPPCLAAAAEAGVALERVAVVARSIEGGVWPTVVAALLDGFDLVVTAPDRRVRPADARRLAARARERGTVVVLAGGERAWPEAPDLRLAVAGAAWEGLGHGHGHLRRRRVRLEASGRREAARPRHADLWLPGDAAPVEPCEPQPLVLAPDSTAMATESGARTREVA